MEKVWKMVSFSRAVTDFKLHHLLHVPEEEEGLSYTYTKTVACVCVLAWVELKHETLLFSAPNYRVCN